METTLLCQGKKASYDFSKHERIKSLLGMVNCSSGPVPLLEDENQRIACEFTTFISHAENQIRSDTQISQTKLWYELLTKVDCFKNCKLFINFALKGRQRPTFTPTFSCDVEFSLKIWLVSCEST